MIFMMAKSNDPHVYGDQQAMRCVADTMFCFRATDTEAHRFVTLHVYSSHARLTMANLPQDLTLLT